MLMSLRESTWRSQAKSRDDGLKQSLHLKVWPTDMDIFMHMTNTRYFDVMKIATNILLSRTGAIKALAKRGAKLTQIYSDLDVYSMLKLLQGFVVESTIDGAEDGHLALSHTFTRGKKICARGALLFAVQGGAAADHAISPTDYLSPEPSALPETLKAWLTRERLNPPLSE